MLRRGAAFFASVVALSAGCSPAEAPGVDRDAVALEGLCTRRCRCNTCTSEERGLCAVDSRNVPALAHRSRCDDALHAWIHCEDSTATCLDGRYLDESCDDQRKKLDSCTGR